MGISYMTKLVYYKGDTIKLRDKQNKTLRELHRYKILLHTKVPS